ncbi:MAG: hypothetical protein E7590_08395 [Ruminococcaceae bacterium]|nr:hypothetical protein [Oscillospiraceae bacterium]
MFSVKENTQRYKSLVGFAIFPLGTIFAFGKRYALWGARDLYHIVLARACKASRGNISHRAPLAKQVARYIAFACKHIAKLGPYMSSLSQLACGKQFKFALSPNGAPFCCAKPPKLGTEVLRVEGFARASKTKGTAKL